MKIYDILELHKMDLIDLCFTANEYDIDFKGKTKQQLIYLILDEQQKQTQTIPIK